MAISVASTNALPTAPATAGVATGNATQQTQATATTATGTTSPFQTLLAAASATAQPATITTAAANAPTTAADTLASNLTDTALNNTIDDTKTDTTGTTSSNLSGLLALAAQILGLPTNAAVAQATGQVPTEAATQAQAPTTGDATRTRADQLRLGRAGGFPSAGIFLSRPSANPTNATTSTQPTTTQTTAATQPTTTTTTPTIPVPALAVNTIAVQTAVAARGGTSSIPAQSPVVAGLIPNVPVPTDPSVTNPPVAAPPAPTAAPALPPAQLGDRPGAAGDRFAAMAEAGAQMATTAPNPPGSVIFANTLDQELTAQAVPASPVGGMAVPTLQTSALPAVLGATNLQPQTTPPLLSLIPTTVFGTLPSTQPAQPMEPSTGTGDTVLPLVNLNTQATAAVVLPPLAMERTGETRGAETRPEDRTSTTPAAGVVNPQAPLPAFEHLAAQVSATPATPAAQVADAVVSHAHVLERDGAVEFRMRLDPPDLGRVQIQLVTRGDEVHGQVLCASDAVRQMIESQMPELRQRLEAAGVSVQQFSVATDPNTGGGNQNAYRAAMFEELAPRTGTTNAASAPRARIGRPDTGSLDVTV